jgi:hypothetical protein
LCRLLYCQPLKLGLQSVRLEPGLSLSEGGRSTLLFEFLFKAVVDKLFVLLLDCTLAALIAIPQV